MRLWLAGKCRALSRRLSASALHPLGGRPLTAPEPDLQRAVVTHGHFYQPPREDPWTGLVPTETTATPDGNWNERITRECYAPLSRAGAFEWLSFDFGPTLLRWLENEARDVYARVIEGDVTSLRRLGHGNAIAQPYHHIILPLASRREKRMEVRWGIEDFQRRFGRRPEGMWLPETAVDRETLDVLAREGIAFTVLAPEQVRELPDAREPEEVRGPPLDGNAASVALDGGREIAVFTYDGALSHGVAFGELLGDANLWLARLMASGESGRGVVSIATDGETFGHHHGGADVTLMEVIAGVQRSPTHRIDNFAACLARTPPTRSLELVERSSWSCAHGVERWRDDCGCRMAPEVDSQQGWRRPLREALEWLDAEFDLAGPVSTGEPASEPNTPTDLPALSNPFARDRGAMFTSCAWFFDDIGGLEPAQNLSRAAHAIDLLAPRDPALAARLDREFAERLEAAVSNDPTVGNAGTIYRDTIRRAHPLGAAS